MTFIQANVLIVAAILSGIAAIACELIATNRKK